MLPCSRFAALFASLVFAGSVALHAQAAPAQTPAPTQPAGPAAASPLKPELQPPLDVDRDPIASPDSADNRPVSPGQPNGGQPIRRDHGIYTFERNVDEVVLNCTVLDSSGHLVNDLTEEDFRVWEDNVPQSIVAFQHSDIPVSMGILIDNSGSMRDKRPAVNEAALDLIQSSNPDDEAFIVNFADEAFLDQDFTSDINKLREGLSHIDSRGGTALYDAVVASADQLAEGAHHPKQVLLVITDGEDNASETSLEETVRRIQDLQGPEVYSIGLLFGDDARGSEAHEARRALEVLSRYTGGIAFFPKSLEDVNAVAEEVARDIRNQYTIGYHSTKPMSEGGYRVVRVEVKSPHHGRLTVLAKPGYYPRPQAQPAHHAAVADSQ